MYELCSIPSIPSIPCYTAGSHGDLFQSITVWSGSKSVSHGPESLMEETGVVKAEDEEEETVYRLQYFSFQVHFNEMYILLDQTLNFKPKDAVIYVEE